MRQKLEQRNIYILGNGFDRAHHLETDYKQFIRWLLLRNIQNAFKSNGSFSSKSFGVSFKTLPKNIQSIEELSFEELIDDLLNERSFRVSWNNIFLKFLLENKNKSLWMNIEKLYYHQLKKYAQRFMDDQDILDELEEFNKGFEYVKGGLEEYLKMKVEPEIKNISPIDGFKRMFNSKTDLILTFNYTSTINIYFEKGIPFPRVIHIHGKIDGNFNPMVFGYGDEHDEFYSKIESLDENRFFPHIKSFMYLRGEAHTSLMTYLNSNNYVVHIIGHSCGLTDKTLLKRIFDNNHCKSIMLYMHGGYENYVETTMEISRHFSNKQDLRDKVIPFQHTPDCPQS